MFDALTREQIRGIVDVQVKRLEKLLADAILNGTLKRGDLAWVDFEEGSFVVRSRPKDAPKPEAAVR